MTLGFRCFAQRQRRRQKRGEGERARARNGMLLFSPISKLERFWKRQCALHFCVLQPRLWPSRLVITQDIHRVRCCITLLQNNCSRGLSEAQRQV
ncbi:hypothetical protein CY35_05G121000 [Sphagnum magellanicum]|nr:hypothetical protein CY35_05G121000 [Sphagnum magellanicum]